MKKNNLTSIVAGLSMFVGITQAQSPVFIMTQSTSKTLVQELSDKQISNMAPEQVQSAMLKYINIIRLKNGLQKLTLYHTPIAQNHSNYLFATQQDLELTSQDHFDVHEKSISTRVLDAKIPIDLDCRGDCKQEGENLASGDMNIVQIVDRWLDSPDHRDNLLSPYFDHIAIGHAVGSKNVVVDFLNLK